jgi:gluconate 2-dehydrogenase gamma chain
MTSRREALKTIAAGALGAATSAVWVESLAAHAQAHAHQARAGVAAAAWKPRVVTQWQDKAIGALAERIIPETETPGALGAGVNRFIDWTLAEAAPADRETFLRGLSWIDARSKTLYGSDILEASPAQQTALLTRLSAEGNPDREDAIGREFFQALKSITITGYYSTEIGLTQELGDDGQLFLLEFSGCDHPEHHIPSER